MLHGKGWSMGCRLACIGLWLGVLVGAAPVSEAADTPPVADASSRNFIRSWLVCGPFPNPLAEGVIEYRHDETTLGFYTDYLQPIGGEKGVQPRDGQTFKGEDGQAYTWHALNAPIDYVNLAGAFPRNERVVAYAACTVRAAAECDAVLALGSNDGVRAWLNGEMVWDNHRSRGASKDDDFVNLHLRAGENLLLVKVDQGFGNWGLYARFVERAEAETLARGEAAVLETTAKEMGEKLTVVAGRGSRFLVFKPTVQYTAAVTPVHGQPLMTATVPLGAPTSFDLERLPAGGYWVEASATLPDGRVASGKAFYHRGASAVTLRAYGRDGQPAKDLVDIRDAQFAPVKGATREREAGKVDLLRSDLSLFYPCLLVANPGLGKRWIVVDNGGVGFQTPRAATLEIDLPMAAVQSLRARMIKNRDLASQTDPALARELNARLKHAALGPKPTAGEIYAAIDVLSTCKATLPASAGVGVWYAPGIEKVSQDEAAPVMPSKGIRVSLAGNEYEPFQVVLRPDRDLARISVSFESMRARDGATLPSSCFAVNAEAYVDVKEVSDLYGTLGPWPDALPSLEGRDTARAGKNTPVWVTVHAPKEQAPGVYFGTVVVRAGAVDVARIPLEVTVYPFVLPEDTHMVTAYGVGVEKDCHGPLSPEQLKQVHDQYMQVCASHRISPYSPHAFADFSIKYEGTPAKPVIDFAAFDQAMTRYLNEFHFNSFNMGGLPGNLAGNAQYTPEYNRLFKETYGAIQEHLRRKGWLDKAYWYWVDEPPRNQYADVKKGLELLKASCPDIRRLLTCNVDYAPVPYFEDAVNLWVPIMDRYDADRAHARQALGEKVWWYVCTGPRAPYPNNFIDHPAINHRARYWTLDKYGLDGDLYWAITYWAQNPWEQARSSSPDNGFWGNGDGRLLYPPRAQKPTEPLVEGPVTSIRFENLRDGLEDDEYLWMLDQAAKGDAKAEAVLETARASVAQSLTSFDPNPNTLLTMRGAVAKAIVACKTR